MLVQWKGSHPMLKATMMSSLLDTRAISATGLAGLMLLLAERRRPAQAEIFPTDIHGPYKPPFRAKTRGEEQHQRRHLHRDRASPQGLSRGV